MDGEKMEETEIHVVSSFNQVLKVGRLDKGKISAQEESGQISNGEERSMSMEVQEGLHDRIITPTITHASKTWCGKTGLEYRQLNFVT